MHSISNKERWMHTLITDHRWKIYECKASWSASISLLDHSHVSQRSPLCLQKRTYLNCKPGCDKKCLMLFEKTSRSQNAIKAYRKIRWKNYQSFTDIIFHSPLWETFDNKCSWCRLAYILHERMHDPVRNVLQLVCFEIKPITTLQTITTE